MPRHIHPVFEKMLSRSEREQFLGQRSKVIWFTGLSGSGKSTLAIQLERKLFETGYFAQLLDGDNIRSGINANLGFSLDEREENIRRIAEIAKLYLQSGVITLCSFISPTESIRRLARTIIGASDFLEVHMDAPLEICEQRDVKGLYQKARQGEITGFTGIDSPYEAPESPFLKIETAKQSLDESLSMLYRHILPLISFK